ncbi:phenoloxidase-activating factor 2-like [Zophobas morio]|uniref:phenoloxidase-activating factor 2-like n=1 Tax=Zophobas morio TaxID=2755281 RepID=UPI0030828FEC
MEPHHPGNSQRRRQHLQVWGGSHPPQREWNVDSEDEPLPLQEKNVEEILINESYNPRTLQNDIALVVLAENFELRDNVRVVCLSTPYDMIVENGCVASGWGKDAHDSGKYSPILKKVQVPIVSREYCLRMLRATKLGPRFQLHKSFICAGGQKGKDSCKGDGGSPLICPLLENQERFVQIGIVSWGVGCGNEGVPGIYVNVPYHLDWIEGELNERELDTAYFTI